MFFARIAPAARAGALLLSGVCAGATSGLAADLPSRKSLPMLVADEPSAIHGYLDFTVANNRVTGGGFVLYPRARCSRPKPEFQSTSTRTRERS